ncbi:MAG: FHA domain-containing protein [Labilithrix sp.]|nr:FHA domain-containing protein [Labilithrix sp.]
MNEDVQLEQWLASHRGVVSGDPTAHADVETLTRHATGQLSAARARAVTEHLMVCEDGRCVAFVRASAEDVEAAAGLLYPPEESVGMRARTFQCREALWQTFEAMAREGDASIDDLLADAMQAYARHRAHSSHQGMAPAHDYQSGHDAPDLAATQARDALERMAPTQEAPSMRSAPAAPASRMQPPPPPPPPMSGRPPLQRPFTAPLGHALPAPPARAAPGAPPSMPRPSASMPPPPPSRAGVPPAPRSFPPPLPSSSPMHAAAASSGPYPTPAVNLTLSYQGRTYEVNKERFLLGRSKSQADLLLDDSNVSRQHAMIERVGDEWFVADLGSTNGVFVQGQRVSRRQLVDGDAIEITTHQILVSLR